MGEGKGGGHPGRAPGGEGAVVLTCPGGRDWQARRARLHGGLEGGLHIEQVAHL